MNATGMNTAMMVKVVAMTASPISAVPSRAASRWSLPFCMWRTMFSRTTIASSISMPMASDRPISVSTFSVKPNMRMAMNAAMTEIGSVRPVMTVERHELRNRNTMKTVSRPPRTSVTCTSSIDSRMNVESSRTICSDTPGGSSGCILATAARTPSATPTVFAPACFCTSSAMRGPLVDERHALRLFDAVDHLRDVAHEDGAVPELLDRECRAICAADRPARRDAHHALRSRRDRRADRRVDVLRAQRVDDLRRARGRTTRAACDRRPPESRASPRRRG